MSDFAKWLRLGLGRANLYLQRNGDAGVREELVYACTHNLAFDRQIDSRVEYLLELIELTGEPGFYRNRIIAELAEWNSNRPSRDLEQLMILCRILAERGNPQARKAMYRALEVGAIRESEDCFVASEVIALDGIDGLRAVAHLAREDWVLDGWVRTLEERDGAGPAWASLSEEMKVKVIREREYRGNRLSQPDPDIAAASQTVLSSSDEAEILPCLLLFTKRKFPGDPRRLMELARSTNPTVAWRAMRALRHVDGNDVRQFALDSLSDSRLRASAVGVVANHHQAGDFEMYVRLFDEADDAFDQHHVTSALIDAAESHPALDAVPALVRVYEANPCSVCRRNLVKLLIGLDSLPLEVREELPYDADLDNRRLISN